MAFNIQWDKSGERYYETGVDRGVLFPMNAAGTYDNGVPWNGLTSVSESPEGAEPEKQYADNIAYLTLTSAEEFKATINAFTYPEEFKACDGTANLADGVNIGQQSRRPFGLVYRTKVGNDTVGQDFGYKIHIIYNATAAPSEKEYATVNDSPEAIEFSWELSTTPVAVTGFKPTATVVIDSTKVNAQKLTTFEEIIYGKDATKARLLTPDEIKAHFTK